MQGFAGCSRSPGWTGYKCSGNPGCASCFFGWLKSPFTAHQGWHALFLRSKVEKSVDIPVFVRLWSLWFNSYHHKYSTEANQWFRAVLPYIPIIFCSHSFAQVTKEPFLCPLNRSPTEPSPQLWGLMGRAFRWPHRSKAERWAAAKKGAVESSPWSGPASLGMDVSFLAPWTQHPHAAKVALIFF